MTCCHGNGTGSGQTGRLRLEDVLAYEQARQRRSTADRGAA